MNRRVVVTGLGVVCPLGANVKHSWSNLLSGHCAISKIKDIDSYEKIPCKIAAQIPRGLEPGQLDLSQHVTKSNIREMSLSTIYGLIASSEAVKDADWIPDSVSSKVRTGVCVGVGMSDVEAVCTNSDSLKLGYSKVSPYFIPRILPNMVAGHISIKYGFQGPNHTVSTACATGCHAIGDAFKFIQNDFADVMVCGGSEASIHPLSLAGFCRLRALCTSANDTPKKASRPFDKKRDGFVMGEGSAILILEELNHALTRDAKIYAEILGYGLSGDASHITAPHENGFGAFLAMERALKDAKLSPKDITYVNAHATSTPLGDAIELRAIIKILGDNINKLAVSSTKGAHGHLLGAAGNLESLFTVLSCYHSMIPPTINLEEKCDEGKNINCVPNDAQGWEVDRRIALKNSFGFGGTNASLCIGEYVP